ncbi:MAG: ATP-binding cassette domain-containing protein [Spirochaetales bacterium]
MKLCIHHVTKNYGDTRVLKDISIDIDNALSVGIIGESGCGKSTLLRQLAGIENPNSGEIFVNGLSPIQHKKDFQNHIGVVFQKHNLFPHLTIKENITLILQKIKKGDKSISDARANELLEKLFITAEANKLPHEVSGGQAQRASIARALSTDPQILFLKQLT